MPASTVKPKDGQLTKRAWYDQRRQNCGIPPASNHAVFRTSVARSACNQLSGACSVAFVTTSARTQSSPRGSWTWLKPKGCQHPAKPSLRHEAA
eukprot:CAMPEP_0115325904 /NCGR_PEP_ID=MMETSP0270-20121206/83275_1 /TAXON_ID=71861 /ORGANISM="Scrippsiella trochoidea, Strain CCMP3099" /LENGTH=93 /DNA_ID=CAMNT_0002746149 /DNA_START=26 /DNA_END=304 /DNA_ORIENTATION=+